MSVKVEFIPSTGDLGLDSFLLDASHVKPQPIVKNLSEGFRKCPVSFGSRPDEITVKRCIPFLDAISTGYVIKAHVDFSLTSIDTATGEAEVSYNRNLPYSPVQSHLNLQAEYLFNELDIEHKTIYKWLNPWSIHTPKGYSCLFLHPLNSGSKDLRFLGGIVDTDTYYAPVNFPFYLNKGVKDFNVKAGDPLIQVIPFKREKHKLIVREYTQKELKKRWAADFFNKHVFSGAYRKFFWHKRKEK